jgi:hypothetical protein
MTILNLVDQTIKSFRLDHALTSIADRFLPSIDAQAGVITCWSCICQDALNCAAPKKTKACGSAPSSQCRLGWPACADCRYNFTFDDCVDAC